MLKFHIDENADHAIAAGLRRRGIDVTTTEEAGMKAAPDELQLAHCLRGGRVIITHDDDLLALHSQGIAHAGIAFSELRTRTLAKSC